jgi:hypothetical protein
MFAPSSVSEESVRKETKCYGCGDALHRGLHSISRPDDLLRTGLGIGEILSLVLPYEIHAIRRFPRVQEFASYCRVVTCAKESAGKR